jgi:hypothetical protein
VLNRWQKESVGPDDDWLGHLERQTEGSRQSEPFINKRFGSNWRKSEQVFRDDFQKTHSVEEGVVIT